MTTDTQRQYSIPEKLQLQGNTYPVINWNDIRTRGLLYKANALVFNPAGLMLFVDVESGVSPGAMEGDFTLSAVQAESAYRALPGSPYAQFPMMLHRQIGEASSEDGEAADVLVGAITGEPIIRHQDGRTYILTWADILALAKRAFDGELVRQGSDQ